MHKIQTEINPSVKPVGVAYDKPPGLKITELTELEIKKKDAAGDPGRLEAGWRLGPPCSEMSRPTVSACSLTRRPSGDIWMSFSRTNDMQKDQPPITTMP